jgi:hypothetical protein
MTDRHKTRPKAVRMPDGLLAWYEQHAEANDTSVNAAMVRALQEFRERNEEGTDFHGIPVVADARMPAGFVALVAPGQPPVVFRAPPATDQE